MKFHRTGYYFFQNSLKVSVFLSSVVFLMSVVPAGFAADDANSEKKDEIEFIPRDTVVAKYKDTVIDAGFFRQVYESDLDELARYEPQEALEEMKNLARRLILSTFLADYAVREGIGELPVYQRESALRKERLRVDLYYRLHSADYWKDKTGQTEAYYEAHKDEYRRRESVRFRHIFFKTVDEPPVVQERAKKRAEEALKRLVAGEDFKALAEEYSSAQKKGDQLGPYYREGKDTINPIIMDALLGLEVNGYSGILETRYGYEILQLTEHIKPDVKPLNEVRWDVRKKAWSKALKEYKREILADTWDEAVKDYNLKIIEDIDLEGEISTEKENEVFAVVFGQPIQCWRYLRFVTGRPKESSMAQIEKMGLEDFVKAVVFLPAIVAGLTVKEGHGEHRYVNDRFTKWRLEVLTTLHRREVTKEMRDVGIDEDELRKFFEGNTTQFRKPKAIDAYAITCPIPKHDEDVKYEVFKAQKEAREPLEKILERLTAGEPFEKLAAEFCEGQDKANCGFLGRLVQNTDRSDIAKAALKLQEGEFSNKVTVAGDFMGLFYCAKRHPTEYLPYESPEVRKKSENAIYSKRVAIKWGRVQAELFDSKLVECFDEALVSSAKNRMEPEY